MVLEELLSITRLSKIVEALIFGFQVMLSKNGVRNLLKKPDVFERAHVEGAFSRWKRVLGEDLSSRFNENIDSEVYIKSLRLNKINKVNCSK
jgi:hypothetical protein